jgi:hypothetical protein
MLYGGRAGNPGTKTPELEEIDDTWVYDPVLEKWMQAAGSRVPGEDTRPGAFAYDPDRDRGVLYQTHKTLETWTLELVPDGPAARSVPQVASVTPKRTTSPVRARSYTATWEKRDPKWRRKPEGPLHRVMGEGGGSVYDSKRKLCIVYGAKQNLGENPDAAWAYDAAADTWTCFLTKAPAANGPGKGAGSGLSGFAYDSLRDRYLIPVGTSLWSFGPDTGRWDKIMEVEKSMGFMGFCPRTGCILEMEGLCRWVRIIDPSAKRVTDMTKIPIASRPGVAHGCLSCMGNDGRFLFFGGARAGHSVFGDTFTFDMGSREWAQVECVVSPPPRQYGRLSYDSRLGVWVLLGGALEDRTWASDTWVYNPAMKTWIEVESKNTPDTRGCICYDAASGAHVLLSMKSRPMETWVCRIQPGK